MGGQPASLRRAGDRYLQLSAVNEECLVGACHQHAPILSLPFVHTARRCYRWLQDRDIRRSRVSAPGARRCPAAEFGQCPAARGSKSRNKVAVGEPAAGSLPKSVPAFRGGADLPRADHAGDSPSSRPATCPTSLVRVKGRRPSTIALIGGCLGSGIDEDRG